MDKHSAWVLDGNANAWKMPVVSRWKRFLLIRHVRAIYLKSKVETHYSVGMGRFGLCTGYDDWVLYGIWNGLERTLAELTKERSDEKGEKE